MFSYLKSLFSKVVNEEKDEVCLEGNVPENKPKMKSKKKTTSSRKNKNSNPYKVGDFVKVWMLNNTLQCCSSDKIKEFYLTNKNYLICNGEVVAVDGDLIVSVKTDKYPDVVNFHIGDITHDFVKMGEHRKKKNG